MSQSPAAHAGHGTGSGRRTMPTTRSPALNPVCAGASITRPSDEPFLPGGGPAVGAVDDLHVGAADADRLGLHQDGPVVERRLWHVGEPDGALLPGDHGDSAHGLNVTTDRTGHCWQPRTGCR